MFQGRSETDSPERTRKVGLLAVLAGAAALAVLLAGLAAGSTGVQAQEAGATYTGPVERVADSCGGGTVSFTVSEDGLSITQLVVDGFYIGDTRFPSPSDPPFVVPLNLGIAIGTDGSFIQGIGGSGFAASIEGQFDGDTLSGTFTLGIGACFVPFSAELVAAVAAPTAAATAAFPATVALPATGSGSAGSHDSIGLWAALAAAAGAVMLAGGLLTLRRRA